MTKLQQAREAAQRAEQAAKEAAELVAQLEKEAEPKVWVHNNSKEHFYLDNDSRVVRAFLGGKASPLNSFPDLETAERVRDWLALMERMRIAADGYEWRDGKSNWSICLDIANNYIKSSCWRTAKHPTIYFASEPSAQDFIDSMTEQEKEVFKRGFPIY